MGSAAPVLWEPVGWPCRTSGELGDYLRKKYNTAIEVTMNQDGTGFTVADRDFKGNTKNELVYVENSPDYCLMDRAAGEWMNEI